MVKRILSVILALSLAGAVAGCDGEAAAQAESPTPTEAVTQEPSAMITAEPTEPPQTEEPEATENPNSITVTIPLYRVYPASAYGFFYRFEMAMNSVADTDASGESYGQRVVVPSREDWEKDEDGNFIFAGTDGPIYDILLTPEDIADDNSDIVWMRVNVIPMESTQIARLIQVLVNAMAALDPDLTESNYELMAEFVLDSFLMGDSIPEDEGQNTVVIGNYQYDLFRSFGLIYRVLASKTESSNTEEGTSNILDAGMYLVGTDIAAGTYKLTTTSEIPGYWARRSNASGETSAIIADDNFENQTYVTVQDGEYFEISRCEGELQE